MFYLSSLVLHIIQDILSHSIIQFSTGSGNYYKLMVVPVTCENQTGVGHTDASLYQSTVSFKLS